MTFVDENESNYKKAYEIFLDLYENDNDPRQRMPLENITTIMGILAKL